MFSTASRDYLTPVSKHLPSSTLHRPLYCNHLLSNSHSSVDSPATVSASEVDYNGRATEVDLPNGITREQHINTGFNDQSMLPKADSKSDATTLFQEVSSKITLMPVAFDRILQHGFTSSDKSHLDYSSEPYVAPLYSSTSQEYTKDIAGTETGKGEFSQKGISSHFGTERSVVAGRISSTTRNASSEATTHDFQSLSKTLAETTSSQTSSQIIGPTSATKNVKP